MSTASLPQPDSTSGPGRLRIELPHWAAAVRIFDDEYRPVANVPPLRPDTNGRYATEILLRPGIYDLEVSFVGRTVRDTVSVRSNRTTPWSKLDWGEASTGAATIATKSLEELIQQNRMTWPGSTGDSRVVLSVRMLGADGEASQPVTARLFNEADVMVTPLRDGAETELSAGTLLFSAALPKGGYVLKIDRPSGGSWCQPLCLCPGWEAQLAITTRVGAIAPTSVSMRYARPGIPAAPNGAATVASLAVLDALEHGADARSFIVKEHIDALTQGEHADPWLAVLAAYALLQSIEVQPLRVRSSGDPGTLALLEEIRQFLMAQLPTHPDVRAIALDAQRSATPISFPPLLRVGVKRVQAHAARWKGTIPPDSVADRVLDVLKSGSPWTTWVEQPQTQQPSPAEVRSLPRVEAPSFLRNAGPKAPIYRLRGSADTPASVPRRSRAQAHLQDAKIVELVENAVYAGDLNAPLSDLVFNSADEAQRLLSVKPEDVGRDTGVPMERVESAPKAFQVGASVTHAPPLAELDATEPPARLGPTEDLLVQYAIGRLQPRGIGDTPAPTIEEVIGKLKQVADELDALPQDDTTRDVEQLSRLADRVRGVIDALLRRAVLIALTDAHGVIRYGNGAFLTFLDLGRPARSPKHRPRSWATQETWEACLRAAPPTRESTLTNIGGPSDTTRWHLRRASVHDVAVSSVVTVVNALHEEGAPTIDANTLTTAGVLAHRISLGASLYALGSMSERSQHGKRAEEALAALEHLLASPATPLATTMQARTP